MPEQELCDQYVQQLYNLVALIKAGYYKSTEKRLLIDKLKKLIQEEYAMKNYLEEIYTVSQFKLDCPKLAEQAERAKQNIIGHYRNREENDFVIIEVEGYKCVAVIIDDFRPYELGEIIAPFDETRIYPIQGLVTEYAFKRYN